MHREDRGGMALLHFAYQLEFVPQNYSTVLTASNNETVEFFDAGIIAIRLGVEISVD